MTNERNSFYLFLITQNINFSFFYSGYKRQINLVRAAAHLTLILYSAATDL